MTSNTLTTTEPTPPSSTGEMVSRLLHTLGDPDPAQGAEDITVVGADPLVPSVHCLADAMSAAIGVFGRQMAAVGEQRGHRHQRVQVQAGAAIDQLMATYHTTLSGRPLGALLGDPTLLGNNDFYRVRDGRWIFIITTYPHLWDAVCSVLRCGLDKVGIARAASGLALGSDSAPPSGPICPTSPGISAVPARPAAPYPARIHGRTRRVRRADRSRGRTRRAGHRGHRTRRGRQDRTGRALGGRPARRLPRRDALRRSARVQRHLGPRTGRAAAGVPRRSRRSTAPDARVGGRRQCPVPLAHRRTAPARRPRQRPYLRPGAPAAAHGTRLCHRRHQPCPPHRSRRLRRRPRPRPRVLATDDSVALLTRALGEHRTAAEPQAACRKAELCGRPPLGSWNSPPSASPPSASPPSPTSASGSRCSPPRTSASPPRCGSPPPTSPPTPLGHHPGTHVDRFSVAALAGTTPPDAARALDRLATAHLLTETAPGRHVLHDLVRLYARGQSHGPAARTVARPGGSPCSSGRSWSGGSSPTGRPPWRPPSPTPAPAPTPMRRPAS